MEKEEFEIVIKVLSEKIRDLEITNSVLRWRVEESEKKEKELEKKLMEKTEGAKDEISH